MSITFGMNILETSIKNVNKISSVHYFD